MQKEFIKYFEDEKLDRLNILETKIQYICYNLFLDSNFQSKK